MSGDARNNEVGDDRTGQTADIELNGVQVGDNVKIYAGRYTVLHDEDGNCYFLIEIEVAGSESDDNNDFFAFYGDVPPAGTILTVVGTGNVVGNRLKYKELSAGLKWEPDDNGNITIEAEDMALSGYRVDDVDDASGGEVIKLKKKEGEASLTFGAEDGVYDMEVAYVDENDGQGSIVVEVNGVVVQTIILDQDDNGNGNDHSTISTIVIEDLNLSQGDTITLRGERDRYEFARIDAISFCPNNPPEATDDAVAIGESGLALLDLLANDSDPDGDALQIIEANGVAPGTAFTVGSADGRDATVIVAPDGALNFAADTAGNFEDLALGETDTITVSYTISDGNGNVDTATVTVTINGENDAPTAVADAFSIGESGVVVEDILGNDSDVDGTDALQIISADGNTPGAAFTSTSAGGREANIIVAPDGALNFAADTNGAFEDLAVGETDNLTVTYEISDGNGGVSSSTVTVTVNGENDGPTAVVDAFLIGESGLVVEDILGNDSDVDESDTLEIISAGGFAPGTAFTTTSADGREATVIVAPSGALNFAADTAGNFEDLALGETDTIVVAYEISDGNGGTSSSTVTVTINGENDGPTAVADAFSIGESGLAVEDILGNDSDVDASDTLTIVSAEGNAPGTAFTVTSAGNRDANIIVAPDGALNLAADTAGNFVDLALGETDTIAVNYTISDGNGGTSSADVVITVNGENDGPVAGNDTFTIGESGLAIGDILSNDTDIDGDALSIIDADGNPVNTQFTVTSAGGRDSSVIIAATGILNFAADTNAQFENLADGETDTITVDYTISDGNGGTSTATVSVTVEGENDDPEANDDAFDVDEGVLFTGNILENDSDVDASDEITITSANGVAPGTAFSITSDGGREAVGILAPNGALNLAIDQNGNFENLAAGETDIVSITYTISDGNGGTDGAVATVTINGQNDDPDALDDAFTFGENGIDVGNLLLNDSDVDTSDVLQITSANGNAIDPALGGATLFNVTSTDGRDAELVVSENFGFNFAFNPKDAFDSLAEGETDTLTFTYDITDNNGGTDTASVTVTVEGANDGPVAEDDAFNVDEGALLVEDLLGNDSDVDATDVITIASANGNAVDPTTGAVFAVTSAGGREGIAIVAASGALNVAFDQVGAFEDLAVGETDTVTITYDIIDGNGGTASTTATITIDGQNDDPDAIDDAFTFNEDDIQVGNLLLNDSDVDTSDLLQITSAEGNAIDPALGGATLFNVTSAGNRDAEMVVTENFGFNVAFNPKDEFDDLALGKTALDTFSYTVSDGNGATDTATATITIVGEGDANTPVTSDFTSNTPNTSQEVSVSLNVDPATTDGTVDAEIDINFGAVLQPQINVVYVVDTSGSTIASVLAEEVAAPQALTAGIAAQGFAEGSVSISIVPFSTVSGPDATGDDSATFVLDTSDDAGTTDLDDINAALNDLTGGGFTNYVEALGEATSIIDTLDPTSAETNVVFFLSDGQPTIRAATGAIKTQTEAEIAAAATPLQAVAQISAFEIGNVDALQFLDALDNTGGAQSVTNASDLSAALLGSPIPEGTVIDADLFIFDDSEVFGTLVQAIEIDVPGDVDDPANPNLVETPLGLELDLELSGLAADLGDANRVSLVVQFDDDGDGIVDLPLFVEVDVFGLA